MLILDDRYNILSKMGLGPVKSLGYLGLPTLTRMASKLCCSPFPQAMCTDYALLYIKLSMLSLITISALLCCLPGLFAYICDLGPRAFRYVYVSLQSLCAYYPLSSINSSSTDYCAVLQGQYRYYSYMLWPSHWLHSLFYYHLFSLNS